MPQDIIELLAFCLNSTEFQYRGTFLPTNSRNCDGLAGVSRGGKSSNGTPGD